MHAYDMSDDLCLPPADACVGTGWPCGLPAAKHVGWAHGGPGHDFIAPNGAVRPERIAPSSITTEWTCTHCGAACDVWGVADGEWMECGECGRLSFVTNGVPESEEREQGR